MAPKVDRRNDVVVAVWHWCGGWKPELIPMVCALYEIADPLGLIDRLLVLRDTEREIARG